MKAPAPVCTVCHQIDIDMTGNTCIGCLDGAGRIDYFSLALMPSITEAIQ